MEGISPSEEKFSVKPLFVSSLSPLFIYPGYLHLEFTDLLSSKGNGVRDKKRLTSVLKVYLPH